MRAKYPAHSATSISPEAGHWVTGINAVGSTTGLPATYTVDYAKAWR